MHLRIDRVQRRKRSKNRYSLRKRGVLESLLPIFEDFPSKEKSGDSRWSRKRKRCVREIWPTEGKSKGREEWKEGDGQTVDQFHASSMNLSRRGWRYKGGSSLFVAANSIQTGRVWIYTRARLCSQFFLRFSKPISIFLFENRIFFNPLSNFLRSNNCPLFPNRVSRDKSFERRANLNNSFSPIVKLECNSTVNQNWCRVLYSRN